ncbi:MAG: SGNH/GDSL hydrolase family protein [Chloroflexi bacterium]|nr:SGNH/GDSL hydrolase family protein [Chloroflexota bacterium]
MTPRRLTIRLVALCTILAGCEPAGMASPSVRPSDQPLRYVALGDSYTIGTSVTEAERWPNQLVEAIGSGYPPLELVGNLGVNGYTSQDVIDDELPRLDGLQPQIVSLLIGVNDVVQGVPEARFRENAARILDELVVQVGATWIFVVSTPDYTVTPAGADYGDPAQQSAAIRRNNQILRELAQAREIAFIDIHDISLGAATDRSLVAGDGLHPSGAQYARWVDEIAGYVEDLLAP